MNWLNELAIHRAEHCVAVIGTYCVAVICTYCVAVIGTYCVAVIATYSVNVCMSVCKCLKFFWFLLRQFCIFSGSVYQDCVTQTIILL